MRKLPLEVVGVLPAAGRATRVAPLPVSKEIFPVGFQMLAGQEGPRPKAVCQYLLEKMALAGVARAYVVLGSGKWDIPAYLEDGRVAGLNIAYLVIDESPGAPFTLDAAYPFIEDKMVALGFPDILFGEQHAFGILQERYAATGADVVIGLFPAERPQQEDLVACDAQGMVQQIVIKPDATELTQTWGIALWTPAFSEFMHRFVAERRDAGGREYHVGDVIQAAIDAGMPVAASTISETAFIDIGTPENLRRAVREGAADT
ncbi:MAG: dTDP-glucose pyrophosphorylase [Pseudomonadota bacterium]|nr:MAG: dTDP-glucose pyrophosphorylase [Pseudomonadota bacterium]